MTRDGLKRHWQVVEAYKNGADVEWRDKHNDDWKPVLKPEFYENFQYRIAVHDWAWACKMMLEGKKVTAVREAVGVLGMNSSGVVTYYPSTTQPHPATIERLHLLATDWRLA